MSFFGGRRQQDSGEDRAVAPSNKPAAPPAPRQPVGFDTVLGANTQVTGTFRGSGNARFDGILDGTLEIDGNILIGETAKVTADVNARNISIAGAVRGNVHGNKVQILRTGRVWGDINAAAITTEEGAFIDGKITMVSHEAALHALEAEQPAEPAPVEEPAFVEAPEFVEDIEAGYAAAEPDEDSGGMMNLFGDEPVIPEDAPGPDPDEEIPPYEVS